MHFTSDWGFTGRIRLSQGVAPLPLHGDFSPPALSGTGDWRPPVSCCPIPWQPLPRPLGLPLAAAAAPGPPTLQPLQPGGCFAPPCCNVAAACKGGHTWWGGGRGTGVATLGCGVRVAGCCPPRNDTRARSRKGPGGGISGSADPAGRGLRQAGLRQGSWTKPQPHSTEPLPKLGGAGGGNAGLACGSLPGSSRSL